MIKLLKLNIQLFAADGGDGAGGTGTSTTGAQVETQAQQPQIDYEKMSEAINKRTSQTADNVLKGYLKQQGLTGEELDQAVNTFKQQKATAEQNAIQEQENMKLENQKLKAQILNSNIDSKLSTLAAAEGVSADKIPFLAKLIEMVWQMKKEISLKIKSRKQWKQLLKHFLILKEVFNKTIMVFNRLEAQEVMNNKLLMQEL